MNKITLMVMLTIASLSFAQNTQGQNTVVKPSVGVVLTMAPTGDCRVQYYNQGFDLQNNSYVCNVATGAWVNINGSAAYTSITGVPAVSLLGNSTGAARNAQAITLGTGLSFSGTVLNGATTPAGGGVGGASSVTTPNALECTTSSGIIGDACASGVTTPGPVTIGGGVGTGGIGLGGATSGIVTIQPQAIAGTFNFNLPITAGTSGQPLLSGGGGSSPMTFGTVGVPAGGTGLASGTSGGIPCYTATTTMASSAIMPSAFILKGGGAGACPAASGDINEQNNGTSSASSTYLAVRAASAGLRTFYGSVAQKQALFSENMYFNGTNWVYDQTNFASSVRLNSAGPASNQGFQVVLVPSGSGTITTADTTAISLLCISGNQCMFNPGGINPTFGTVQKLGNNPNSTADNLADVQFNAGAATHKAQVIQGFASQSANIAEVQKSDGTLLGGWDSTGNPILAASNSTSAVAGVIGTTCPAITCTAAYTWIKALSADGSTVYFPVWK